MTTATTYFGIATFGTPAVPVHQHYTDEDLARQHAREAKGTGSCSAAKVYASHNSLLASSCDISEVRPGERIIFVA